MAKLSFDIEGMSCDHCVRAVKNALESVPGVSSAEVRVGHADVECDGDVYDAMVTAIEEEGYRVTGR